jgi:hypothetical protein
MTPCDQVHFYKREPVQLKPVFKASDHACATNANRPSPRIGSIVKPEATQCFAREHMLYAIELFWNYKRAHAVDDSGDKRYAGALL